MKSCVVYESMYGNTHDVAAAIAESLSRVGETSIGSVAEIAAGSIGDIDLLVVGGPTHMHGMSRSGSRKAAVDAAEKDDAIEAEPDATGQDLRAWLDALPKLKELDCAAFDTRIDKSPVLVGSAAKGITKQLRRHRFRPVAEPESFFVEDTAGPLQAGELERAKRWGATLAGEWSRVHK